VNGERYTVARAAEAGAPVPASAAARLPDEAELLRRFGDRIRLFAARRLGSTVDAEDVAQETLRRVLDALRADRIRNPAAFPAFVFETARHICQQRHRSSGRERSALERLHAGDAPRAGAAGADPLVALVRAERRATVRAALDRLGASDRALLRTLYYDDATTESAAQALAITPVALRVRKHRALRRLSQLLMEHER
jgi:RNA polymerase sigma factor (sigma-70 family)